MSKNGLVYPVRLSGRWTKRPLWKPYFFKVLQNLQKSPGSTGSIVRTPDKRPP